MAEKAKVISIENNVLTCVLQRSDACGDCHACDISENKKEMILTAYNQCDAKVGETVEIELSTKAMMTATVIMYVVPLITMFLGFLIGNQFSETFSFTLGIVFLVITYLIIRLFNKRIDKNKYMASAIRVVNINSKCSGDCSK